MMYQELSHQPKHRGRTIWLKKKNGGHRKIEIPNPVIKKHQRAILRILEPIYEPKFEDFSYGFRKDKGPLEAVKEFNKNIKDGFHWVASLDIEDCFSNINPKEALKLIDSRIDGLVGFSGRKKLPQGYPCSPFLANLVLDQFDQKAKHWKVPYRHSGIQTEYRVLRYADNIWLMCRKKTELECYLSQVSKILTDLGFKLRFQVKHVNQGINVLGFSITKRSIGPHPEAIQRFRNKMIEFECKYLKLVSKPNSELSEPILAQLYNLEKERLEFIRGWKGYYLRPLGVPGDIKDMHSGWHQQ